MPAALSASSRNVSEVRAGTRMGAGVVSFTEATHAGGIAAGLLPSGPAAAIATALRAGAFAVDQRRLLPGRRAAGQYRCWVA